MKLKFTETRGPKWNHAAIIGVAMLAATASAFFSPSSDIIGSESWHNLAHFGVAIMLGVWLAPTILWSTRRYTLQWWVGTVLMGTLAASVFFSFNSHYNDWTVRYPEDSNNRVVKGAKLLPAAEVYRRDSLEAKGHPASDEALIMDYTGRRDEIWDEEEIKNREQRLSLEYFLSILLLASTVILIIQATNCSLMSVVPEREIIKLDKSVFISYRRQDTAGETGHLADTLKEYFEQGRVFMDLDKIIPGEDFMQVLADAVGSCDVLLAVIGPDWVSAKDDQGNRRLNEPRDFVRLEIASALKRNIRVIPVLVSGAVMPRISELPEELHPLTRRHAHEISNSRWEYDTTRLVSHIAQIVGKSAQPDSAQIASVK